MVVSPCNGFQRLLVYQLLQHDADLKPYHLVAQKIVPQSSSSTTAPQLLVKRSNPAKYRQRQQRAKQERARLVEEQVRLARFTLISAQISCSSFFLEISCLSWKFLLFLCLFVAFLFHLLLFSFFLFISCQSVMKNLPKSGL